MEEQDITLALSRFLSKKGWTILSVHFPGAQGGFSVNSYSRTKKERWIPDLISLKKGVLLTIETKQSYSHKDVRKLNKLYKSQKIIANLKAKLNLPLEITCQKAIAYCGRLQSNLEIPSEFVVFVMDDQKNFSIYYGANIASAIINIIQS